MRQKIRNLITRVRTKAKREHDRRIAQEIVKREHERLERELDRKIQRMYRSERVLSWLGQTTVSILYKILNILYFTTIIVVVAVALGWIFGLSQYNGHGWILMLAISTYFVLALRKKD